MPGDECEVHIKGRESSIKNQSMWQHIWVPFMLIFWSYEGQWLKFSAVCRGLMQRRFCSHLGMTNQAVKAAQEAVQKSEELDIRYSHRLIIPSFSFFLLFPGSKYFSAFFFSSTNRNTLLSNDFLFLSGWMKLFFLVYFLIIHHQEDEIFWNIYI